MSDESSAAAARFRAALDRRAEDRDIYKAELRGALTLREYLDIQHSNRSAPQQASANVGFPHLKRRPS